MNGEGRMFKRLVLPLAAILLLAFLGVELFRIGPPPEIMITPALPAIGRRTPVEISLSEPKRGLSFVRVEWLQGDRIELLAERSYETPPAFAFWNRGTSTDTLQIEVGRDTVQGLRAQHLVIRVTAGRAGTWLRRPVPAVENLAVPVRLHPPSLQVMSTQTYAAQGGCEAVVYRVGDTAVRDGVRAGDWWFPGYPLPGGTGQERFALFALPYDQSSPQARLKAEDDAGNEAESAIVDRFFPRSPRTDIIELSDSFLNKVVPEIMAQTPDLADQGTLLDNYLAINGDLRQRQDEELKALAGKSRPEFLWHQPFLMMPNAQVMASFAERRTYKYQGRVVDQQVHLGYDQAAVRRAPVPAANDGLVVLARYFGIYGNTVILDHGCGLMTVYGHLSTISVAEGGTIARGQVLGQTGETGLAGGDHLHFAILLHGLPVTPVEWWDGHWIRDRIARKLGGAWQFQY
ncbi:MAG: M23 family metallopeptidase [Acidobacteriota bacterium]